jgi:hypothetical protein
MAENPIVFFDGKTWQVREDRPPLLVVEADERGVHVIWIEEVLGTIPVLEKRIAMNSPKKDYYAAKLKAWKALLPSED